MSKVRQTHLDSMRGLAAFIVILVHFFTIFYPYSTFGFQKEYVQHFDWEPIFHYFPFSLLVAGRFAVCLFFILSGYVLTYSYLGESNCRIRILAATVKRPIRLGGMVLFTIIVGALLWANGLLLNDPVSEITRSIPYFKEVWAGDFDFLNFIQVFLSSPFQQGTIYNPPLWTISIELYGSMLIFAIAIVIGNFRYRLVCYIILYYLFKESFYQGFIIGILLADLDKNYRFYYMRYINSYSTSILLCIGLVYASTPIFVDRVTFNDTFYSHLPDFYSLGGSYAMNGAALVFFATNLLNWLKLQLHKPVFRFLGHISYGLYVIHFLVMGSLSSWIFLELLKYMNYLQASMVTFVISTFAIIIFSYLVTKLIDKPAVLLASKVGRYTQKLAMKLVARYQPREQES